MLDVNGTACATVEHIESDVDNKGVMPETVPQPAMDLLDSKLLRTSGALLVFLTILTTTSLGFQWLKYNDAIETALKQPTPDHAAALSYARSLDAAVMKTSALMLAFVVVFLGAMYVLRASTAAFQLDMSGTGFKGTLASTSPGLVMVTLGLVLVAITLLTRSDVNYEAPVPSVTVQSAAAPQAIPATPTLKMEKEE